MRTSRSAKGYQRVWERCEPHQQGKLKIISEPQAENHLMSKRAEVVLRYQNRMMFVIQ